MSNGAFTTTDLIAEMARQHPHFAATGEQPDLGQLLKIIQTVAVDSVCPETGATPLLWTIENDSPFFNFLLVRAPDVNLRGAGKYDIAPIDLAMSMELMKKAETLAQWGAPCPPEIKARWEAEKKARKLYGDEIKKADRDLEKRLKSEAFQSEVSRLEVVTGVTAKKIRGRRGHLSFPNVPVHQLASKDGLDEDVWFANLQAKAFENGTSLFSAVPIGAQKKQELCIAPTTDRRQVISVSNLLCDEGAHACNKMMKADVLDTLSKDYPFHLLTCGRMGVVGKLEALPSDIGRFGEHLFSICRELCTDYEINLSSQRGNVSASPPDIKRDLVPLLIEDVSECGIFWLPWGVDY